MVGRGGRPQVVVVAYGPPHPRVVPGALTSVPAHPVPTSTVVWRPRLGGVVVGLGRQPPVPWVGF